MADVNFIDGQALDPTSFGEVKSGIWIPKDTSGLTFGTNGFRLQFPNDIDAGSSYYFDGSSDSVVYSSSSLYDVGSSDDFELECFFNTDMVSGSGDYGYMLGNYDGSSQFMTLQPDFRSANEHFAWYIGNGQSWGWDYTSGDIKPNTWHHITISRTSGTLRMFLDGVRLTNIQSFSASNGSISGGNVINNTTSYNLSAFRIGESYAGQKAYKGYVSNVRFIVGSSIRNSDSSFTVPTSTLTDVTNTKLLTATSLTIGDDISSNNNDGTANNQARASGVNPFEAYTFFDDVSGNNNNWSPNNLTYTDVVLDAPTNNFAVMNPLNWNVMTFAEGNLKISTTTNNRAVHSTFAIPSTGKWIYEFQAYDYTSGGGAYIGFSNNIYEGDNEFTGDHGVYYQTYDGGFNVEGTVSTATGYTVQSANFTSDGDIHTIAIDMDNQKLYFAKNGAWRNSADPAAGTGGLDISACFTSPETDFHACITRGGSLNETYTFNFGQDSTFAGATAAGGNADENGYGDFKYAPPSGFLSLCSANLPKGAIDTLADETPEDYFNTVLYTGNGGTQSVSGVGFQPDLVWLKKRSNIANHNLIDSVRGAGYSLFSNTTDAETNYTTYFSSFDADGFTLTNGGGSFNGSGDTFVAWNWKAGGSGVSNTDGSITSTVSVSQTGDGTKWFSVVGFTTQAGGYTVGHGLGQKPSLIITKNRDTAGGAWYTFTDIIDGSVDYLALNQTSAKLNDPFGLANPTSSVFSLDDDYIFGSGDCIAYCFANAENLCRVGSYTGNGSTDGTFVYTGFRPAWVMIKRTNTTGSWVIQDSTRNPYNDLDLYLLAESSNAEATLANVADYCSNGFKLRLNASSTNASGSSYIYLALAEQPFKYANAR
jgi:hypothetical protein